MKLIMTGGGDSVHFEKIDKHFVDLLGEDPKLLFIPLAGEQSQWNDGLARIKMVFSTINFNKIEMCVDLAELDWSYIKQFGAIYIDGGNTFDLMAKIRHTHTFELLHKFLHHGGIINGDSAGAIVLGSHLETAHFGDAGDINNSDIVSYQGLNLLGHWAIHCHYVESEDKEILDFSNEYGFPILALYEETSVFIKKTEVIVIGEKKACVFKAGVKSTIEPNQKFHLFKD